MHQTHPEPESIASLLQDLEDIICCYTPDGVITYCNPACSKRVGFQICEAPLINLGSGDIQFKHLLERSLNDISCQNPVLEYESQVVGKDGQTQWFRWKVRALYNQPGQVKEYQAIGREISCENKYAQLLTSYQELLKTVSSSDSNKVAGNKRRSSDEVSSNPFRRLTDTTPACIFIIQDGQYRYANNFFTYTMGYTIGELLKINYLDLIHPDCHDQVDKELDNVISGRKHMFRQDIMALPRNGSLIWLDVAASVFQWEGRPAILGAAYDVTHRMELQAALMQSEYNFRQLADAAPNLIFVLGNDRLIYVNKAYIEKTGYTEEECLTMESWEFFHPHHWDMIREMTRARRAGAALNGRYQTRMTPKDQREAWTDFTLSPITFNGQPATLGVAIDITEQKVAQLQVEYLSYHDKLTGLYNRAYMDEKVKKMDGSQDLPLSIIMGDVNGLKMVNDAFGHSSGDLMLQKVAHILSANCRKSDLIARWGGDEFVIMLPNSSEETARRICAKVYQACTQLKEFPVQVSIALGTATMTLPEQSLEDVFKDAEDLMYRNKMLESRSARSSFLNSLEQTLWVRSHETQEHTVRLRHLVIALGQFLGLTPDVMNNLTLLAALHDIGKIAIPNNILDKSEPLTPDEWEVMKRHPEIGYRIALANPELAHIANAILHHHERWDGQGYPLGAKGQDIPLISRILAIADSYDVMISGRPYQPGISQEEALQEIISCAGTQFDPELTLIFIELIRTRGQKILPA
ncbi:MAG: PAS domain S-box protein [Syntrophomonadaceae bacterium]